MIEVWYKGECWDGSKQAPIIIGQVATVEEIEPLVRRMTSGGVFETKGEALLFGVFFAAKPGTSKTAEALKDLLAILRGNDLWNPDPRGVLAQAVEAGVLAIKEEESKRSLSDDEALADMLIGRPLDVITADTKYLTDMWVSRQVRVWVKGDTIYRVTIIPKYGDGAVVAREIP